MAQIKTRIVLRNDSTVNWNANASSVLMKGEVGIEFLESGKVKMKVGDGTKTWAQLPYFGGEEAKVFEAIAAAGVADGKAVAAQNAVDTLAGKVGTVPADSTVMGIIKNIQENAYDDTEVKGLINDLDNSKADKTQVATDIGAAKIELEGKITEASNTAAANLKAHTDQYAIDKAALQSADAGQIERIDILENKITGLTGAMHFRGVIEGDQLPTIADNNYVAGDVVLFGDKEFVCDGNRWVELGDEGSLATQEQVNATKQEAINTAAADATTKANAAQAAAEATAKNYTDTETAKLQTAITDIPEQIQSNLSESDKTSKAYVSGVIRQESLPDGYPYEVETDRYTVIDASNISWRTSMGYSATVSPAGNFVSFSVGSEYIIETNGYSERVTCKSDGEIYSSRIDVSSRTDSMDYHLYTSNEDYNTVKVIAVTYNKATLDEKFIPSYVAKLPHANVGQLAAVKTVDNSGVPTEWKAMSIPSKIVTAVNGTAPDSKGNVTIDVYTKNELAAVATSGQYQDLEGVPVSKITSELSNYYQLDRTKVENGNEFHYTTTFNSSEFGNNYKDRMLSFSFRKSPAYGGTEFLKTDYKYPKITASKYNIWGNCSLYSSSYENTGETWCVYIGVDYIYAFSSDGVVSSIYVYRTETEITQLSEEFIPSSIARIVDIPKASAVPDAAGETPTAAEFNALLAALRAGGIISTG